MIEIQNLSKKFDKIPVLKDLNLKLQAGKVSAILGPNASGKTTLLKCILGLIKPDSGQIYINGQSLNGNWNYRRMIGYMPQFAKFPENLSPREVIHFIEKLRGNSEETDLELYDNFRIKNELYKPFRTLSGGTKQKVSAILAFLFYPEILILDEPTAGLDPISSQYLKKKIEKEKLNGKTIVLTSHMMSEVEEIADDIIFMVEGNIYFEGAINRILENFSEKRLESAIAKMMQDTHL